MTNGTLTLVDAPFQEAYICASVGNTSRDYKSRPRAPNPDECWHIPDASPLSGLASSSSSSSSSPSSSSSHLHFLSPPLSLLRLLLRPHPSSSRSPSFPHVLLLLALPLVLIVVPPTMLHFSAFFPSPPPSSSRCTSFPPPPPCRARADRASLCTARATPGRRAPAAAPRGTGDGEGGAGGGGRSFFFLGQGLVLNENTPATGRISWSSWSFPEGSNRDKPDKQPTRAPWKRPTHESSEANGENPNIHWRC